MMEIHRPRTEEELRRTISMLCHFVWHKQSRPGEHFWTIPPDKERDFDFILHDAVTELVAIRTEIAALKARYQPTAERIRAEEIAKKYSIENMTDELAVEIIYREAEGE